MTEAATALERPLVEARGLTKRYGTTLAVDGVSLAVAPGEAHALLGENGAGKSTLVKMLYGLVAPESGDMLWRGRAVAISGPKVARALGIGMVFQHFSLFDDLTVAENVALALPASARLGGVAAEVERLAQVYRLPLDPAAKIRSLSVGERQRVEIVRCLMQDPKLLILDEPTAVLTPQEAENLFETLDRLIGEGRSVLYITHRLEEVRRLCGRVTVLRAGKVVACMDPRAETAASLARAMVGADVREARAVRGGAVGAARLVVTGLDLPPETLRGVALTDVAFRVHAGEILGIAGVAGNGQGELFAALSGERLAATADAIVIDGAAMGRAGVTARRRAGAAFTPEERLGHAAAPGFRLSDNVLLTGHATEGLVRGGMLRAGRAKALAAKVIALFDVRAASPDPEARALSGGNLQKFVVGRELVRSPKVLVVDQPTWGVDAGAAAAIREKIVALARSGAAVLIVSQDLDELFALADRVAVLHGGRLSQPRAVEGLDRESVGLLMGGAHPERAEAAA